MELREKLRAIQTKSVEKKTPRPCPQLPFLIQSINSCGETYYNDHIYIDYHGQIDLKNFPEITAETLRFFSRDTSLNDFSLKDTLFFDIETTGTAGGTGTYAFLVGLGFVEKGFFQIRQYFLHDLAQESAFLKSVEEYIGRFQYLISYNGKCFDSQILRNRYLMHRWQDPFENKKHVDMLHIARRLWKRRFRECDLMNLERQVLNFFRVEDIPGYLIPSTYVEYLRSASVARIRQVLEHNQWDILSLAVLTARACLLESGNDLAPEEHYSLSLLYERQKNYMRAIEHQRAALHCGGNGRHEILISLARNLRRVRDVELLQWLVQEAADETMSEELCRRLCIVCEHDLKDVDLALRFVELQIQKHERFRGISSRKNGLEDWKHRQARLQKKIKKTSAGLLPMPCKLF